MNPQGKQKRVAELACELACLMTHTFLGSCKQKWRLASDLLKYPMCGHSGGQEAKAEPSVPEPQMTVDILQLLTADSFDKML